MDQNAVRLIVERYQNAKALTHNWRNTWAEAARYCMPQDLDRFNVGYGGTQPLASGGRQLGREILDDTGLRAVPKGAAALNTILTPDGVTWHHLRHPDPELMKDRQAALWYEAVNTLLFSYRYAPMASYKIARMAAYSSVLAYGNGPIYIDSSNKSALRYRACFIGDVVFDVDESGSVDTAYRLMLMKPRQMLQAFGEAALPDKIRDCIKGGTNQDEQHQVLHAVTPNTDRKEGRAGPEGRQFVDCYLAIEMGNHVLAEGGHDTFPYAVDRYLIGPSETYARGPAQLCMTSILTLQRMKMQRMKHGDRVVDPVLFLPEETSPVSLIPGARNYGYVSPEGRNLVSQLQMNPLGWAQEELRDERQVVEEAMLVTFFRLLNERKEMTATEVLELLKERGALFAPLLALMQASGTSAMIARELELLDRAGLLPEMPGVVREAGGLYEIEYDNLGTRMLKAEAASGFQRAVGALAELSNLTQDPSPLYALNTDVAVPDWLRSQGIPERWIASEEQIAAKQDAAAQAQERQQMIEAAPSIAATLKATENTR